MDVRLSPLLCQFALVYLDDINIFSLAAVEHIEQARTVLLLLHRAGVMLILSKCNFFSDEIDCLGHVMHAGQFGLASHATHAMQDISLPRNVTELKSFFGLFNVYRRIIPNFARIAASLNS